MMPMLWRGTSIVLLRLEATLIARWSILVAGPRSLLLGLRTVLRLSGRWRVLLLRWVSLCSAAMAVIVAAGHAWWK
jgi:hypothetical protein